MKTLGHVLGHKSQSDAERRAPNSQAILLNLESSRLERLTVCTRPFRPAGPRLEQELFGGKRVIHNYGHGGSGWSLTWGCAEDVLQLARQGPVQSVAVIGAGAMGLVTALRLAEGGFATTIYAEQLPQETGSSRATGSWSPDSRVALAADAPSDFAPTWERWARRAYAIHQGIIEQGSGAIEYTPRYLLSDSPAPASRDGHHQFLHLEDRLADLSPPHETIAPAAYGFTVPFAQKEMRMTFNIAHYTDELVTGFHQRGGEIKRQRFHTINDVLALPESTIINCAGYGAKALFGDETLIPVRGQIAWLARQPEAQYGIDYGGAAALSRRDGIVIQDRGRTDDFGFGINDETTSESEFQSVLTTLQSIFPNAD